MRIIKAGHEYMPYENALKHIEQCARVCYKSEDKITADGFSARKMVGNLVDNKHYAMLEHGWFIVQLDTKLHDEYIKMVATLEHKVLGYECFMASTNVNGRFLLSGNVRAWLEFFDAMYSVYDALPWSMMDFVHSELVLFAQWCRPEVCFSSSILDQEGQCKVIPNDCQNMCVIEAMTHKRATIKFTCDRGVSHELVRHRPASFAQESTRYCNYGKGQFGSEITVIEPCFLTPGTEPYEVWRKACERDEVAYFDLLSVGCTPQEARSILPNSLKTEVVVTATYNEWYHIFWLRACNGAGRAHPQMHEIMVPTLLEAQKYVPSIFGDLVPVHT